ncbi:MAG: HepT-like ribonuclease domain-containing protein [Coriobacteriia bacterium]|nr:HepT-like ribonuclease domain-containing protein [Coriobacteriia bacterium]
MRRSPAVLLVDAIEAADSIRSIVSGTTMDEYLTTRMLRSAIERELLIIGEALNALEGACPDARERVTDLGRIVGLRNRLAHGYDAIDDAMVWSIALDHIPRLLAELRSWLAEAV